jgi:integrase
MLSGATLFIRLALFTLQRMTAILRLTVEQVDLTRSRINFHPPGEPITSKRYAVVPIADTIWGEVAQAVEDSQSGYVVEYRGEPVTSVKSAMRAASKAAGIKTVTPQVLRRTAATLLAGAGVPMREIAGMLGHTQIRTTERYAQHSPEYLKHAADTLDDLMG